MENIFGIYCVDDDKLITLAVSHQLKSAFSPPGFHIEAFNNPIDALEQIEVNTFRGIHPRILVIDFEMPEMKGDELIRKLKQKFPEAKAIMLSGNSDAIRVSDLADEGLLDFYLSKPWSREEIIRICNSCLPLNRKLA